MSLFFNTLKIPRFRRNYLTEHEGCKKQNALFPGLVLERQKYETFLKVTKNENLFVSQLADDVSKLQDVVGYLYSQVKDMKMSLRIGFSYEKILYRGYYTQRIL